MRFDVVRPRSWTRLALAVAIAVLPRAAHAQEATPDRSSDARVTSVSRAELGVLVEAAGLQHWTLERVENAVAEAGMSLFATRAEPRRLRTLPDTFPQGVIYQGRGDSAVTVFVALVEPEDAHLVKVRAIGEDTTGSRVQWPVLGELARAPFGVLERGVRERIRARAAGLRPKLLASMLADSAELRGVWRTLDAHSTSEDAAAAREVLTTSPHVDDRVAAVAILSSFPEEDAAWHALVGALLDPNDRVREYAHAVLHAFLSDYPRRVDWRPAAADLHALLAGSVLMYLPDVLDLLVATGVGPELAGPLLEDGGHAVLMFAGAQNPWARGPAHRFLRAVSGRQSSATPAEWRAWIAEL